MRERFIKRRIREAVTVGAATVSLVACSSPGEAVPVSDDKIAEIQEAIDNGSVNVAPYGAELKNKDKDSNSYFGRPFAEVDGKFSCDINVQRRYVMPDKLYAVAANGMLMEIDVPDTDDMITTVSNRIPNTATDCLMFDPEVDEFDPKTGLPTAAYFAERGKNGEWINVGTYHAADEDAGMKAIGEFMRPYEK